MDNPIKIFTDWFEEAKCSDAILEPTVMALATATKSGKPSVRIVLLKDYDERGFVFYTNMESRKSEELKENPQAALCFLWNSLGKQVRIEGKVEQVSDGDADVYYNSRPLISRIGAIVSRQSRPLESREQFLAQVKEAEKKYSESNPPKRPTNWSGWRVIPDTIEFWQEEEFRLHDRNLYTRVGNTWTVRKLYP